MHLYIILIKELLLFINLPINFILGIGGGVDKRIFSGLISK